MNKPSKWRLRVGAFSQALSSLEGTKFVIVLQPVLLKGKIVGNQLQSDGDVIFVGNLSRRGDIGYERLLEACNHQPVWLYNTTPEKL